jgi:tetratricopeptide (TPR) repeat protein
MTGSRKWLMRAVAVLMAGSALANGLPGHRAHASTPEGPPLAEIVSGSSLSGSYLAAQMAAKENDDEAAVAFYERSLALDPQNEEIRQLLFLALLANGRISSAVDIARSLPPTSENNGVTRLVLAVDAVRQKSWAGVDTILGERSTAELDGMVEALLSAWAAYGAGDAARALETAQKIEGPEWVRLMRDLHCGLIASSSGDDAKAETFLIKATENPAAAAYMTQAFLRGVEALYRAQARQGKAMEAAATLQKGLSLLPNHPPFRQLEADAANAAALAPLVVAANQGAAEIFYHVGTAVGQRGGSPFAQSYLQLANHLNPGSDALAMALAEVFEKQKRPERANAFYETIAFDSPYHRRSQLERALNLNDLKQVEEAKTALRTLIEEDPVDIIGYQTLGGVLSQHEEYAEATAIYDKAVEIVTDPKPFHWNLFYRRGIAYERLKQWEKAEPNFKKSLELSPDQPDVLNYLGYSWIDMGINLDEGMAMIRKAVELKPRSGYIVDSLGWAHYRLGQYEDAVRELERAVELMPQDPVVNDHLGDAYWKVGRKLEATFQWNHALAFEPAPEDEAKIRAKLERGMDESGAPTAAKAD